MSKNNCEKFDKKKDIAAEGDNNDEGHGLGTRVKEGAKRALANVGNAVKGPARSAKEGIEATPEHPHDTVRAPTSTAMAGGNERPEDAFPFARGDVATTRNIPNQRGL